MTIPLSVLGRAGLSPGDELRVEADGERIVLVPTLDLEGRRLVALDETLGCLTGIYPEGYLDELRGEWR